MSKKDKILDELSYWHSVNNKALSVFIALCGFAFCAAGGVIKAPLWLVILSALGASTTAIGVILIYKKIKKITANFRRFKVNIFIACYVMLLFLGVFGYLIFSKNEKINA